MKFHLKDFRVKEGDEVDLKKRPTIVDPVYQSKAQYEEILAEHVAQLSALQQLLYASSRHAVLLIFQAMDAAGKDGAIRHVMSGVNPQGCQVFSFKHPSAERAGARLSLAHDPRAAGARADRHLQPILLRGSADRPRAQRSSRSEGLPDAPHDDSQVWHDRYRSIVDLERHLHVNGTRIVKVLPPPLEGGAAQALPGAHRRAGQELEVQPGRHRGEEILEAVHEGL